MACNIKDQSNASLLWNVLVHYSFRFVFIQNCVDTNLLKYMNFPIPMESSHHMQCISHSLDKSQKPP